MANHEQDELEQDIRDTPVVAISGPPVDLTEVLAHHLHKLGYRKVSFADVWRGGYRAGQMDPHGLYPTPNPYEAAK